MSVPSYSWCLFVGGHLDNQTRLVEDFIDTWTCLKAGETPEEPVKKVEYKRNKPSKPGRLFSRAFVFVAAEPIAPPDEVAQLNFTDEEQEEYDWALLKEAYDMGQLADDAKWQLAKPIREALIRLIEAKE